MITVFISGWTKGSVLSNPFYGWVPPFLLLFAGEAAVSITTLLSVTLLSIPPTVIVQYELLLEEVALSKLNGI